MSFSPEPSCPPLGCSSIQEQRERWERKRCRTARELVQTEQHYCRQLELLTTFFVEILKAKGTLKKEIREEIFSSIEDIHSINKALLVHLENGDLVQGLEEFCLHLNHYYTYVNNYYNADRVLTIQLKKSKAFRRFKKLQESRPELNHQTLEDLLQLPVQRITQYKHFLQDLAANTSPDNPEFQQLSRAESEIGQVSDRIQDNHRRHQNHLQLCRVQKLLIGRKTKVLVPGRWFLREGWLKVVPAKGAEAKPKMFFLFSDILLQARPCAALQSSAGGRFRGQRAYPLQDATVEKVFGHTSGQGGLLSLTFPRANVLLMSNNQDDLNLWFHTLTNAVRKLQSKSTVILQRDQPLRSAADNHTLPISHRGRKRNNVVTDENQDVHQSADPSHSAPKRLKASDAPEPRDAESSSSCVIL